MGGYGYGYGLAWIPELIIWIVIIVAIVALVKSLAHHGGGGYYMHGRHMMGEGPDALEILKQRYAKGEIAKKEYEEMKKDIAE